MTPLWTISNPKIKTLDCTIRDGGLVNDHYFTDEFVSAIYRACVDARVDYMELGYKNSSKLFSPDKNGLWKFCKEDDLRRIVGENPTSVKLACMIDAAKSEWKTDVLPKSQSPLDMIRVAFYAHQTDEAIAMIEDAYEKGYEVSANLMAVTVVEEKELDAILERLTKSPAAVFVIVDSFGSLTLLQTEYLAKKYFEYASSVGKEVGAHFHNNMQLAFANTLLAANLGATRLDASFGGLGRGAGNCPMELLLATVNPEQYDLRPVYHCLEDAMEKIKRVLEWGASPQFNITGQHNVHPRAAIAARKAPETHDKYVQFYDQIERETKENEANG